MSEPVSRDQDLYYLEELQMDLQEDLEVINAQGAAYGQAAEESHRLLVRTEGVKQYLQGKLAQVAEALVALNAEPSENGVADPDLIKVAAPGDNPGE